MAIQPVETKRTYCRVCMTHCGLVADVAGDRIVRVRGDFDHPITRGYTCPKGRATDRIGVDDLVLPTHHKCRVINRVNQDVAIRRHDVVTAEGIGGGELRDPIVPKRQIRRAGIRIFKRRAAF